jgi:hypothetical protein
VDEATLATLREALALSPDNVPLREHLAATLLAASHAEEAEAEYREALTRGAGRGAQLGRARAFFASASSARRAFSPKLSPRASRTTRARSSCSRASS